MFFVFLFFLKIEFKRLNCSLDLQFWLQKLSVQFTNESAVSGAGFFRRDEAARTSFVHHTVFVGLD